MKNILIIGISLLITISFFACEKQDPFVDRIISPLLITITGSDGIPSSGLTTEPSVTALIGIDAKVSLRFLELNKAGLLDYKVGIDSIPAKGLTITYKLRNGTKIKDIQTNDKGIAVFESTWTSLGIPAPKAGSSVKLTATGTYKDITFSKYFTITGK